MMLTEPYGGPYISSRLASQDSSDSDKEKEDKKSLDPTHQIVLYGTVAYSVLL